MQPFQRFEECGIRRGEDHLSAVIQGDEILIQRQAVEGEQVVDPGVVVIEGEFHGDFILLPVPVRVIIAETAEHLRQLIHRGRHRQGQRVQPVLVDEEVAVRIDALGNQEAQLIDMPVRSGQLVFQAAFLQPLGVVGQEAAGHIVIQRKQLVAGNAVLLHVEFSADDQVRQGALGEGQRNSAAPFSLLDVAEGHMDARLLLNLLVEPEIVEVDGHILNFILKGGQGDGLCGGRRFRRRTGTAAQQQRGSQQDQEERSPFHTNPPTE